MQGNATTDRNQMLDKWTDRELKVIEAIIAENSGDLDHKLAVVRERFELVAERLRDEEAHGVFIISDGGILRQVTSEDVR